MTLGVARRHGKPAFTILTANVSRLGDDETPSNAARRSSAHLQPTADVMEPHAELVQGF